MKEHPFSLIGPFAKKSKPRRACRAGFLVASFPGTHPGGAGLRPPPDPPETRRATPPRIRRPALLCGGSRLFFRAVFKKAAAAAFLNAYFSRASKIDRAFKPSRGSCRPTWAFGVPGRLEFPLRPAPGRPGGISGALALAVLCRPRPGLCMRRQAKSIQQACRLHSPGRGLPFPACRVFRVPPRCTPAFCSRHPAPCLPAKRNLSDLVGNSRPDIRGALFPRPGRTL